MEKCWSWGGERSRVYFSICYRVGVQATLTQTSAQRTQTQLNRRLQQAWRRSQYWEHVLAVTRIICYPFPLRVKLLMVLLVFWTWSLWSYSNTIHSHMNPLLPVITLFFGCFICDLMTPRFPTKFKARANISCSRDLHLFVTITDHLLML